MSQTGEQVVNAPIAKAATSGLFAGATWGINTWADVAAVLAALYSLALLLEWLWKKAIRPYCEYRGWLNRVRRRREDFE